jgi:hypothetical protein
VLQVQVLLPGAGAVAAVQTAPSNHFQREAEHPAGRAGVVDGSVGLGKETLLVLVKRAVRGLRRSVHVGQGQSPVLHREGLSAHLWRISGPVRHGNALGRGGRAAGERLLGALVGRRSEVATLERAPVLTTSTRDGGHRRVGSRQAPAGTPSESFTHR